MGENKQTLLNTEAVARVLMLSERRIQQLAKEQALPAAKTRPYMFDLLPTVQAYIKHLNDRIDDRQGNIDVSQAVKVKAQAEAELKRSKADMAALQLAELQGKMHRSEDVEAVVNGLVFSVRSMIMALPGRLAVDVAEASTAAEAEVAVRKECHKMLEELAGYTYDEDEYKRRVRAREGWRDLADDGEDG